MLNVLKVSIVASGVYFVPAFAQTPAQTPAPVQNAVPSQNEYQPMTQEEQFHHFVVGTFGIESLLRSAAGAGILQLSDTPAEWKQGALGYGRRFGNSYAQQIMRHTLMYAASDLLGEDNRYIASGQSGVLPRVKYAVESAFLARKPDGTRRLSYSRLGSVAAVAFISREWQPHSTNGAQNAGSSIATTLGSEVAFNIAREFWPAIFHRH